MKMLLKSVNESVEKCSYITSKSVGIIDIYVLRVILIRNVMFALTVAVVVSSPQGRGMTRLVVCPRGVVLRKCGRVDILPTPSTIHAHCLPPSHERNDGEAVSHLCYQYTLCSVCMVHWLLE